MTAVTDIGRFGSGQAVRRIEDAALLAGGGRFTDDLALPGQAHLAFLRSPHAHARILSMDTAPALAVPGVVAVITGEDLAAAGVKPMGLARLLPPAIAQSEAPLPRCATTRRAAPRVASSAARLRAIHS